MKTAIITGISGQDGKYLADELIEYKRRIIGIDLIYKKERLCEEFVAGDITDPGFVNYIVKKYQPDEIYNLAAHTFVGSSWDVPYSVIRANTIGVLNILEACKNFKQDCKIYQASTSEMFGNSNESPQNESTPLNPVSPYGAAKVCAHHLCRIYRDSYDMWVACGIGLNHESPIRPKIFVTSKIAHGVARIAFWKKLRQPFVPIKLGNLNASRDWSHAADIATAMRFILEADEPDDWVVSSDKTHTVKEFCEEAFKIAGINVKWRGEGLNEIGVDEDNVPLVKTVEEFYRPIDLVALHGDSSKIRTKLKWKPQYDFKMLVKEMVESELLKKGFGI